MKYLLHLPATFHASDTLCVVDSAVCVVCSRHCFCSKVGMPTKYIYIYISVYILVHKSKHLLFAIDATQHELIFLLGDIVSSHGAEGMD